VGEVWNAANGNFIWGQVDREPLDGQAPTTTWAPGAIIADRYAIPVAADAPPGVYRLAAGLYGLVDGARLPVYHLDGAAQGDAVQLGTVNVSEKR
jgi:hypothetical protein